MGGYSKMGAGSSVNLQRVQIQNNKLITTNMSVVPVRVGNVNSNLYSVQRHEVDVPRGGLTDDE